MSRGKKKKSNVPKPRHVWQIKPETRVKPSEKIYRRPKQKRKKPRWVDDVDWYGEELL